MWLVFVATSTLAQQQRCNNAHNLIDKTPISIPSVTWNPAAPLQQVGCFQDTLHQPYWFKFTALTSGSFEFALTSKNLTADYDFILYSDACPCDTSSANIVACNWLGWVTQLFGSTGIANDPYKTFNVTDTIAWAEFERTVQLKAGTNYYLLVDNISNNSVGFDIQFGGSALIGKALPDMVPKITAIEGETKLCEGIKATYTVKSNTQFKDYQWFVPKDAKINGTGQSVEITWGKTSGAIKVIANTTCHKDSFSININADSSPNLAYLDKDYFCKKTCFETNNLKINDLNNNNDVKFDIYNNGSDAWTGSMNNLSEKYICKAQSFWVRGTVASGCFDTLQIDLKELENPSVVLLGGGVACPGDTVQLNFSFTGKAPYIVSYTDGSETYSFTTNNNIYAIKKTVNKEVTYKITSFSEMSNLCQSSIIGEARFFTPANCVCLKRAGTMNPMPVEACGNSLAKSLHNADHQAGLNDALAFILHSTPAPDLGTVYATAAKPEFLFKNGLMYDKLYYISSVLGVKKGNGEINLSDPCLGISAGVPVMFHEPPTAVLTGDSLICKGAQTDLLLLPTGKGPYKISFEANGFGQDFTVLEKIKITGVPQGNYQIKSIEDVNNCVAKDVDTLLIKSPKALTISNKKIICNANNTAFCVTFDVNGGETGTYYSLGQTGVFTKNSFKSEEITSGSTYIYMVKDANGCDSLIITGTHKCDCNAKSDAGTMTPQPIVICASISATASYLNDQKLAANHILGFVLRDSSNNLVSYNKNIPNFKFENGMKTNRAYFIAAVAGINDGSGKVDLTSNCTTYSTATPIIFVEEPTANFTTANQTICEGDSLQIAYSLSGFPNFSLSYKENNQDKKTTSISTLNNFITIKPLKTSTYTLSEIKTEGTPGCKGTLGAQNSLTINVADGITYQDLKINCAADKKTFNVSFSLSGGGDNFLVNGISLTGKKFLSSSFSDASDYKFKVETQLNCKPIEIKGKGYCSCPPDAKITINTIVPIRCHDDKMGMLEAETTLKPPCEFVWNTGKIGNTVSNLKAGVYSVTVTNKEDCKVIDSVRLVNPEAVFAELDISSPKCMGDKDGDIVFENVMGGTAPYSYSIDNKIFTNNAIFNKLKPLTYEAVVMDKMGCRWEQNAVVENAEDFYVELGQDLTINLGEEVQLRAFTSATAKSLTWNMPNLKGEYETLQPMKSTKYEVTAESMTGCKVKDAVWIYVDKKRQVFAPTTFSPNGDGTNDSFTIFSGSDVAKINNFRVFDRWGTLIYEQIELNKNDETMGWQGTYRNYMANEGIYLYSAEVLFIDGKKDIIQGDVKLMR